MTQPPLVLTLPFALLMADNHRLIPARGRLIANSKYRDASAAVVAALLAQTARYRHSPFGRGTTVFHTQRLAVHLAFYFPDRRKRDQTNYTKQIHDCMSGIVYEDDRQIDDARQTKALDRSNPRVVITITPLGQQEEAA